MHSYRFTHEGVENPLQNTNAQDRTFKYWELSPREQNRAISFQKGWLGNGDASYRKQILSGLTRKYKLHGAVLGRIDANSPARDQCDHFLAFLNIHPGDMSRFPSHSLTERPVGASASPRPFVLP